MPREIGPPNLSWYSDSLYNNGRWVDIGTFELPNIDKVKQVIERAFWAGYDTRRKEEQAREFADTKNGVRNVG